MEVCNPEILAPAGSPEALRAAVRCGANAVYLGLDGFNARQNAINFDKNTLSETVSYCHEREVSVYLTLNTLIRDSEMDSAVETLYDGIDSGIDAVILQDIGLLHEIRRRNISIPLHASTQMSVFNEYGVRLAQELGFKRVVLARELSLRELEKIAAAASCELEVFVHGALCVSLSGQCFISSFLGGRSGNRGLCAQPCRLPFSAQNGTGHDLSLKDLMAIESINRLSEIGIKSFKIEGRMKRPEYVAAAVTAYRQAIDGQSDEKILNALKSVFSRSGFTNGYLTDKTGREMFGTRQKEDVLAANEVLSSLEKLYENENPLLDVKADFSADLSKPSSFTLARNDISVTVIGEVPEIAKNEGLTEEAVLEQLSKTGGTQFNMKDINIDLEKGLFLPKSELNRLRRNAVEELSEKIANSFSKKEVHRHLSRTNERKSCQGEDADAERYCALFRNPESIPQNANALTGVFISAFTDLKNIQKVKNINKNTDCYVPRGAFNADKIAEKLDEIKEIGIETVLCPDIGALMLAKEKGFNTIADFGMNIFNSSAAKLALKLGAEKYIASAELKISDINRLSGNPCAVLYSKFPLMLTRNCPAANGGQCKDCKGQGILSDRKEIDFPVTCENGVSMLHNSVPLYMAERQREFRHKEFFLYFYNESQEEIAEIIEKTVKKQELGKEYTRGLYYKGTVVPKNGNTD